MHPDRVDMGREDDLMLIAQSRGSIQPQLMNSPANDYIMWWVPSWAVSNKAPIIRGHTLSGFGRRLAGELMPRSGREGLKG